MGCEFKVSFSVHLLLVLTQFRSLVTGEPQVPCYFIFGDSLVDSGNNNRMVTTARANYPPYGVDFPKGRPTGRFTNGRTTADIIGQLLGFKEFIPPFANATDEQISRGVNYASGGSGIRTETGSHLGNRFGLDMQLIFHDVTIGSLSDLQQNKTCTSEHLSKCIYIVWIGSNDYINNYIKPHFYNTSRQYNPDQYAAILIQQYSKQLTTLFGMGARKIAVFGLAQIGCTPGMIAAFGTNGKPCVEKLNDMVRLFNERLKLLVDELNVRLDNAKFIFINVTSIQTPNPSQIGPPVPNDPCCEVRGDGQCAPNTTPCFLRAVHIYYDDIHPSETATLVMAARSYTSISPLDAHPYDISHLARL